MLHCSGVLIVTFGLGVTGCGVLFEPKGGGPTDGTSEDDTGGDVESGEDELAGEDEIGSSDTDETGFDDSTETTDDGSEDTGAPDLGGGCDSTPAIDPRRSLIETNPAALIEITMAQILGRAASSVDLIEDPQFTYTRLIDSFSPAEQAMLPGGSHCDDALIDGIPSLGGYPIQCPRAEAGQVGNLDAWFPIAAINRFDLAADDGSDCGEQRLILANNQQQRMFVIFEARIPNPEPSCGLLACRPVVDFWVDLTAIDNPLERAQQLRLAFLDGHPALSEAGFEPFMSAVNLTFGTGQIRTNSFDQEPWTLRQFRFGSDGDRLGVIPVPVEGSVFGSLWNDLDDRPQGFACRQSILASLKSLLVDDVAAMGMLVDPICFAGESSNDGTGDYATALLAGSGAFEVQLGERLLELGSNLTPIELANRASFAVGCIGCHEAATGLALGHGVLAPLSSGFVHVDELNFEACDDGVCFAISPALAQEFLPARQAVLEDFLAQSSCDASCESGDPGNMVVLHEGPATAGIPSIDAGAEPLLAWERRLQAGLSPRTLSGRPRGAH